MTRITRPAARFQLLLLLLTCAAAQATGPATAPTSAPTAVQLDTTPFGGLDIPYPRGWTARELSQLGGLLIICPTTEADWQANVFIELKTDARPRALNEALDVLEKELKERKRDFKPFDKHIAKHPRGFEYGVIDYTCKDVAGLDLVEHEMVIPLPDDKRLFLLFSTAESVKDRYEPIFEQMVEALKIKP